MRLRRADIGQPLRPQPVKDHVHPLGALEGRHKLAIGQLGLRGAQAVVFGIDRDHGAR